MCITNQSWDHFDPIEDESQPEGIEKTAEQPAPKQPQPTQWFGSRPAPSYGLNPTDPE